MDFSYYKEKVLAALRARPSVGGLEISDSALRFAKFDGRSWQFASVRLAPGLVEANRIKNHEAFVGLLKELGKKILGEGAGAKKINVAASLSSVSIYSQVFGLPLIKGENLEKAVQLNIQMVSPVEVKEAYSGWQLVGEDKDTFRLEILSAFIERSVVDELSRALEEGGFTPVAIESRALSLARIVREKGAGLDPHKPYILVSLDNTGIDFLVLRRGQLYFEYFNPWKDVEDDKRQVSVRAFESLLTRSLYQVLNFYSQHWPDPVREVVVSAVGLDKEVDRIVRENFALSVQPLALTFPDHFGPEWFIALGAGLRGLVPRSADREISLLGLGAQETFRQEQMVNFLSFWKVVIPVVLGVLLITFASADLFLSGITRSIESQSAFQLGSGELANIASLEAQAGEFNRSVALIKTAEQSVKLKAPAIEKIAGLVAANGLTLDRVYYQSAGVPVVLTGEAKSEDQILNFKKALDGDQMFQGTQLPLSDIKTNPDGTLSFSMSFGLNL